MMRCLFFILALLGWPPLVAAQSLGVAILKADARTEIAAALYAELATQAAAEQVAEARMRACAPEHAVRGGLIPSLSDFVPSLLPWKKSMWQPSSPVIGHMRMRLRYFAIQSKALHRHQRVLPPWHALMPETRLVH